MGLFTEDGVPKNLHRHLDALLSPGEQTVAMVIVVDGTAQGTDLLAGDGTGGIADVLAAAAQPQPNYGLVLTTEQVFFFRMKNWQDQPLTGIRRDRFVLELHGEQIEPSHVVISYPGVEPRRFEVPQLYRRQVAAIAAAVSAPRPPAAHA